MVGCLKKDTPSPSSRERPDDTSPSSQESQALELHVRNTPLVCAACGLACRVRVTPGFRHKVPARQSAGLKSGVHVIVATILFVVTTKHVMTYVNRKTGQ